MYSDRGDASPVENPAHLTESCAECPKQKRHSCRCLPNLSVPRKMLQYLIFIPPTLFLWAELRFTVNMPYWDDYDSVLNWLYQFSHSANSTDRFTLLLRQHNEHRILFDRLIELLDIHLFGVVNFLYLNLFGFFGLIGTIFLIFMMGRRLHVKVYELIPVSLLLFTFAQHELISFAMASIQMYWNLFFSLLAIIILTRSYDRMSVAVGFLVSVLASFTSAGGLILFPTIFLFYVFTKHYRHAIAWLILSSSVFYVYFILLHYHQTAAGLASHKYAANHIGLYAKYIILFLGNVAHTQPQAVAISTAEGIAWLYLLIRNRSTLHAPMLIITLLVLATAAADGLSRMSLGMGEALSSRYTPYSALLLSALYIQAVTCMRTNSPKTYIFIIGTAVSLFLYAGWYHAGIVSMRVKHSILESELAYPVQSRALVITQEAIRSKIFIPVSTVYAALPQNLPLGQLSLYRPGYFGHIDKVVTKGGILTVSGWAADRRRKHPATAVIVAVDGHYYPTWYARPRPGIAKRFNQPGYLYTGYTSTITLPQMTGGMCGVVAITVSSHDVFQRSPEHMFSCR